MPKIGRPKIELQIELRRNRWWIVEKYCGILCD